MFRLNPLMCVIMLSYFLFYVVLLLLVVDVFLSLFVVTQLFAVG